MKTVEVVVRIPVLDLRVVQWVWAHLALAWQEEMMARMDHRAPPEEWLSRIHKAQRWRSLIEGAFPSGRPL